MRWCYFGSFPNPHKLIHQRQSQSEERNSLLGNCMEYVELYDHKRKENMLLEEAIHTLEPQFFLLIRIWIVHDDVIKWQHFPRYWPFVRGIHRSPVNSPHKGHWRGALMFSLICVWINGWLNNREAGDLRRYRAHCDVTVMSWSRDSFVKLHLYNIFDTVVHGHNSGPCFLLILDYL